MLIRRLRLLLLRGKAPSPASPRDSTSWRSADVLVVGDVARAQLRRFGRTVVDPGSGVEPVLIVRVHEMLYALDARCPHLGRSLVDARSRGTRLQCRGHDWTVDLDTGACLPPKGSAPPLQARRYEVWAEGSLVLLRIPSPNSRHTTW